jgi:hypothetical protein
VAAGALTIAHLQKAGARFRRQDSNHGKHGKSTEGGPFNIQAWLLDRAFGAIGFRHG